MKILTSRVLHSSFLVLAVSAAAACGSDGASAPVQAAGGNGGVPGSGGAPGNGGTAGAGLSAGSGGVPGSGGAAGGVAGSSGVSGGTATAGASGAGGSGGAPGTGGASGSGGKAGATGAGGAAGTAGAGGTPGAGGTTTDGGSPGDFWGDTTTIPVAKNVMTFKFINRTNKFPDSKVYWSFKSGTIDELHPLSELSTYDMPGNASGRMYFYVVTDPADPLGSATAPRTSKYNDFIEHTIGATTYNGNTTRVDAWGLKIAMRMHCKDGYDIAVGDDYAMFAQTREATFAQFIAEVPPEFAQLAQPPNAPYNIPRPEHGTFGAGKALAGYMGPWIDQLWASNGLTVAKPTAFCGPIAGPSLSAACHRHVGLGALNTDGTLKTGNALWADGTKFYPSAPANYYAKFWHDHGLLKRAYGFPYDDVGGWSSYISHGNPQWMIVAIGW